MHPNQNPKLDDPGLDAAGLPTANYVYQVEVRNAQGVHRTCKMMTAAH